MNTEKEFDWYAFARKLGEMKDQIGECIEIVDKLKAGLLLEKAETNPEDGADTNYYYEDR